MKVQDILIEVWDDENEREFENPIPHDSSKMEDAFEYMDEVDGDLVTLYKQERGIKEFPSGAEYGKALQVQRNKFGEITNIPLNKILASETHLHKDHIDKIIKDGDITASSKLPILYKMGAVYFVGDGNHRIAAEMIRGKKSVEALVLDADRILNQIKNKG